MGLVQEVKLAVELFAKSPNTRNVSSRGWCKLKSYPETGPQGFVHNALLERRQPAINSAEHIENISVHLNRAVLGPIRMTELQLRL